MSSSCVYIVCAIIWFISGCSYLYQSLQDNNWIYPCIIRELTTQTCNKENFILKQNVITISGKNGYVNCKTNNCSKNSCDKDFSLTDNYFCYLQPDGTYRLSRFSFYSLRYPILTICSFFLYGLMMLNAAYSHKRSSEINN